ncbi:MAG: potassium-transporting ATPase subunit KdpC [Candidatus Dormiibacterota bacterium]
MVRAIPRDLITTLRFTIVFVVICCFAYTFAVTGVAQLIFPSQANGSIVSHGGQQVGSKLIGQNFTDPKYFHGRQSATVDANASPLPYNAQASGGSNLAPTNQALIDRVKASVDDIKKNEPGLKGDVPVDLVTADFSGFDPYITPASAQLQVARIAANRHLDPAKVQRVVDAHTEGPQLGVLGEKHVNVLALNLALDDGEAN